MWKPQRLTTLWASTACYRDSFTLHSFTSLLHSLILGCLITSRCRMWIGIYMSVVNLDTNLISRWYEQDISESNNLLNELRILLVCKVISASAEVTMLNALDRSFSRKICIQILHHVDRQILLFNLMPLLICQLSEVGWYRTSYNESHPSTNYSWFDMITKTAAEYPVYHLCTAFRTTGRETGPSCHACYKPVLKSTIFWDITRITHWKSIDVSEDHIAFILRVKEEAT
jgi:hypothetical protein